MIYWMKGEKFIEELAGHIREGEIRYRTWIAIFFFAVFAVEKWNILKEFLPGILIEIPNHFIF